MAVCSWLLGELGEGLRRRKGEQEGGIDLLGIERMKHEDSIVHHFFSLIPRTWDGLRVFSYSY